jgi:hypothetical protein
VGKELTTSAARGSNGLSNTLQPLLPARMCVSLDHVCFVLKQKMPNSSSLSGTRPPPGNLVSCKRTDDEYALNPVLRNGKFGTLDHRADRRCRKMGRPRFKAPRVEPPISVRFSSPTLGSKPANRTAHKFKVQSARRNFIKPLSSYHRLDRFVSFTPQVAVPWLSSPDRFLAVVWRYYFACGIVRLLVRLTICSLNRL